MARACIAPDRWTSVEAGVHTSCSESSAPSEHSRRRHPQNAEVPPDGPRGDVEIVQSLHLVEGQLTSARDLPESGHAGAELESTLCRPVDCARLGWDERSWADQ